MDDDDDEAIPVPRRTRTAAAASTGPIIKTNRTVQSTSRAEPDEESTAGSSDTSRRKTTAESTAKTPATTTRRRATRSTPALDELDAEEEVPTAAKVKRSARSKTVTSEVVKNEDEDVTIPEPVPKATTSRTAATTSTKRGTGTKASTTSTPSTVQAPTTVGRTRASARKPGATSSLASIEGEDVTSSGDKENTPEDGDSSTKGATSAPPATRAKRTAAKTTVKEEEVSAPTHARAVTSRKATAKR
jgi:hypothetical protein